MVSLFLLLGHSGILPLWPNNRNFIKPFVEKNLQSSSYDVSLSSEIQVLRASSAPININDQMAIDRIYERKDISEGYLIKPGEYVHCKLKESITLPDDVMAMVVPRTRFTRLGLLLSAQYCNPSYSGTLRLGLRNASNSNISLVPGLAIGQLLFASWERNRQKRTFIEIKRMRHTTMKRNSGDRRLPMKSFPQKPRVFLREC